MYNIATIPHKKGLNLEEIAKACRKLQKTDPMREFYSVIDEIRDLYENQGYKKAIHLFAEMKKRHKWGMEYSTFTRHFNKEIKKNSPQNSVSSTPMEVENTPKQNTKREIKNESDARPTMTPEREAELRMHMDENINRAGYDSIQELNKQFKYKE